MAAVTRESIATLHDKIIVNIQKEDYMPVFEKNLKQYSKQANIPGFRKGNVPAGLVRKMFGQSVFTDAVLNKANEELNSFLTNEKPNIFAQPLPLENADIKFDMNAPEAFNFEFEIGLKPEFEIDALQTQKGKISKYVIEIDDKMLNEEIDNIRKRAGKVENPDTLDQDSDMVYAAYQKCDAEGNIVEGAETTEDVVTLDKMPKALEEKLRGQKSGFTTVFKASEVATDEELKELLKHALKQDPESQEAADSYYQLTLTKIGRIAAREMNEDFFEEVFPGQGIKDEAAFGERIKEEMSKEINRIGGERLQNELFEMLVHNTNIELPTVFLKSWLKKGQQEQSRTDEEVEQEWPSFEHQLRWTLISDKLIKDNNLEVTLDEIKDEMKDRVMAYFGNSATDAPWLEDYIEKMTKDEKTLNETYRRLLSDKIFEATAQKLEVKEQSISLEDFQKLPSAHEQHHHHAH
ncbi:MAG TPA: trigger factor [Edaphocola sp.]|nr:trigger factor [Edaphocola sp.]